MSGLTKRVDTARGHSYKLDSEPVVGVTTAISKGLPKPALLPWGIRETATYAANNLELLEQLDVAARIDLLKGAPYRDRDAAAKRGSEVHAFAEKLVRGEDVDVPDELAGHVESCARFMDEFALDSLLNEAVVGNRKHRYMGTLDGVGRLTSEPDGARPMWLFDFKTNRSGVFGDVSLQLAAYRYAEFYLDGDSEKPMPSVDKTGVAWIRADGYDLVPVVAGPEQFRSFLYVQQVANFCDTSKSLVGDSIARPRTESVA